MGNNIFTYITGTLIFAVIALIVLGIVGIGGGFATLFNIGQVLVKIPGWVWVGVLILWGVSLTRG